MELLVEVVAGLYEFEWQALEYNLLDILHPPETGIEPLLRLGQPPLYLHYALLNLHLRLLMPDRIPMQHPPHPRQLPPRPTHRLLQNTRDFRLDAGEVGSSLLEMVLDSLQLAAGLVDELLDVADVPGDGVQGGVVGAVTGEVVEAGQLYSAGALQLLALSDVFEADQLLEALQVAGHWLLQPPGQHITPILGSPVHGGILPEVCTALQPDLIAQAYASPHILLFRVGLFDVALELCFRLVAQTEAHFVTERGTLYAVASRTEQVEARRVFRFAAQWLGGQ